MQWIEATLTTPAENLACDEALLNLLEEGEGTEVLRFWEPRQYFVVLGSSNRVEQDVDCDACNADGIPILRRHSGGGCVLQGPGCLNFSLVVRISSDGPTRSLDATTRYILQRHATAIAELTGEPVSISGVSDLTIAGRKFSGNAQRRRLKALLFHGTFLLSFDITLMERYLKMPQKQPAYRAQRHHRDFVRNLSLSPAAVRQKLITVWGAQNHGIALPQQAIAHLVETKYARREWNYRL